MNNMRSTFLAVANDTHANAGVNTAKLAHLEPVLEQCCYCLNEYFVLSDEQHLIHVDDDYRFGQLMLQHADVAKDCGGSQGAQELAELLAPQKWTA